MRLQTVPAREGALWVRRGFLVFFRRPLAFTAMFFAFMFAVFLLMLLPLVGSLALLALLPLVSLGFMIATRMVLDGRLPTPLAFVQPLRTGRPRLHAIAQLGVLYAVGTYLIVWLSNVVDGGALEALFDAIQSGDGAPAAVAEKLADPRLSLGIIVRCGLAALLSLPFWHAPALVHWGSQSSPKALFFSTVACWRNRGAFVVYALTWFGVIMLFALLANIVFALLGQPELIKAASVLASLVFSAIFYASLYFTFTACFVDDATAAAAAPPPEPPPAVPNDPGQP